MTLAHKLGGGLLALAAATAPAHAERRSFTFAYGYGTQGEAQLGIELWSTQIRDGLGDPGGLSTVELQLGIDYGVTDKTDVAIYQTLAQAGDGGLAYDTVRLELRHRFAERGEWPVDLAAMVAASKIWSEGAGVIEPRVILARTFGSVSVVANLIGAIDIAEQPDADGDPGDTTIESELTPGWAAGLRYELVPQLHLGAESWGWIDDAFGDGESRTRAWAGPAISWAPSTRFWAAITGGFALTDASDDLVVRFLLAVAL